MPVKAIYIMSSPRGGSTLLSFVLGQHSAMTNLGEVSFIPKLLALRENCTCGAVLGECAEWGRVFAELASTTGVDMRESPYGLHLDDATKWKDGSGKIDHARQTPARLAIAQFRGAVDTLGLNLPAAVGGSWATPPSVKQGVRNTMALYSSAAAVWQKEVVVDASKLPRKAVHLYRAYPEHVRILHLARDGRGVSASRMSHMPFERAVERWKHYHSITKELLNRWVKPAHQFSLRYEDFSADPGHWLKALCGWMDIPYDERMLEFSANSVSHSAGGNPTRFKLAEEGIRPVDDRWRTKLTAENISKFEALAGSVNRQLGYR